MWVFGWNKLTITIIFLESKVQKFINSLKSTIVEACQSLFFGIEFMISMA